MNDKIGYTTAGLSLILLDHLFVHTKHAIVLLLRKHDWKWWVMNLNLLNQL